MNFFNFPRLKNSILFVIFLLLAALPFLQSKVLAAEYIKIGMSLPLTGPISLISQDIYNGVKSYVEYLDNRGGIKGKLIKLVVYDDNYKVNVFLDNMDKLVKYDSVLCIISPFGSQVVEQIAQKHANIPIVFPLTTISAPGFVERRNIFPSGMSYEHQVKYVIPFVKKEFPKAGIGIIYSQDQSGKAGAEATLSWIKQELPWNISVTEFGLKSFIQSHKDIEQDLKPIMKEQPRILLFIANYELISNFLKVPQVWKSFSDKSLLVYSTYTDPEEFRTLTKQIPNELYIYSIFPHSTKTIPTFPKPNFFNLYGYTAIKLVADSLMKMERDPSPNNLMDYLATLQNYDNEITRPISYKAEFKGIQGGYFYKIQHGEINLIR